MTALPTELKQAFETEKGWLETWKTELESQTGGSAEVQAFRDYWIEYLDYLIDYHDDALGEDCEELKDEYIQAGPALATILGNLHPSGNKYLQSLKKQIKLEEEAGEYILDKLKAHCP